MRPSERAQVIAGLPSGTLDDAIAQIEELARRSVLPTCAPRTPPPHDHPTHRRRHRSYRERLDEPGSPAAAGRPPAPETPTTVTAPRSGAAPVHSAADRPATVTVPHAVSRPCTALPPPPPEPGTNCRAVS